MGLPEPRTFEYSEYERYEVPLSYGYNSLRSLDRFLSEDYRLMPEGFRVVEPLRFGGRLQKPFSGGYSSPERFRLSGLRSYDLGSDVIKFHTTLGKGLNRHSNDIIITVTGRNPGKVHYRNARTGRIYPGNQFETVRYLSRTPVGNVVRRAPGVGTALSVVDIGFNFYNDSNDGWRIGENTAEAAGCFAGGVAGFKGGALIGAKVGVWFGGFGAVPGSIIGGVIGAIAGSWGGRRAGRTIHQQVTKSYK